MYLRRLGLHRYEFDWNLLLFGDLAHVRRYIWDFGDRSRLEQPPPVEHEYRTEGKYKVKLTLVDADGNSAHVGADVAVAKSVEPPPAQSQPQISISRTTLSIPRSLQVTGTAFPPNAFVQFTWTADGGAVETSQSIRVSGSGTVSHAVGFSRINQAGTYNIYGQVTGGGSRSNTARFTAKSEAPAPVLSSL